MGQMLRQPHHGGFPARTEEAPIMT